MNPTQNPDYPCNALAATGEFEAGLASNHRAMKAYGNLSLSLSLSLSQKQRYALVTVAQRLLELGRLDEAYAPTSPGALPPRKDKRRKRGRSPHGSDG